MVSVEFQPTAAGKRSAFLSFADSDGSSPQLVNLNGTGLASTVNFGTAKSFPSGGKAPSCVQTADLNHDGELDLVVTNATSNNVAVLLGNGDGTFKSAVTYGLGNNPRPMGVTIADFNKDGAPDFAVVNELADGGSGGTVTIFINKGNGAFNAGVDFPTGISPLSVTSADLNNDGN